MSAAAGAPGKAPRRSLAVRNLQHTRPVASRLLRRIARALLEELLGKDAFDLNVLLVDARRITRLNEQFLKHQGPTDVLAFDYTGAAQPEALAGEICVCVDEAVKQARRFRTNWQTELVRYTVHGVLHLCGYDDQKAGARREMKQVEKRLLLELSRRFSFKGLG
ncbi:MAG TPA: rRNA maturation RNase YbeY [Verrucomicrobiae bacterium]|nr:rRNA maturation RNase YbeY [Verrucomicrobiae bacterium]